MTQWMMGACYRRWARNAQISRYKCPMWVLQLNEKKTKNVEQIFHSNKENRINIGNESNCDNSDWNCYRENCRFSNLVNECSLISEFCVFLRSICTFQFSIANPTLRFSFIYFIYGFYFHYGGCDAPLFVCVRDYCPMMEKRFNKMVQY